MSRDMMIAKTGQVRPVSDTDSAIGFRIRQARQRKGWSQKKLAAHLGISFQQIYKYEQGINRITPSRLALITQALGIEPNDLFGIFETSADSMFNTSPISSMDQRAYDLWHRIEDAHSKRVLLELMRVISQSYFSHLESR